MDNEKTKRDLNAIVIMSQEIQRIALEILEICEEDGSSEIDKAG